jgi:hypothetical protein
MTPHRTPPATDQSPPTFGGSFTATLWRYPGPSGWYFVDIPHDLAPPVTHGWGRTPVVATANEITWNTSVWRGKDGRTLLALPRHVRGAMQDGDPVACRIAFTVL